MSAQGGQPLEQLLEFATEDRTRHTTDWSLQVLSEMGGSYPTNSAVLL